MMERIVDFYITFSALIVFTGIYHFCKHIYKFLELSKKEFDCMDYEGGTEFTTQELNLLRHWYNAVEDLNETYLEVEDKELYEKIKKEITNEEKENK